MPNIDLINALIDTYQPGNKGYMDVQRSQDWGLSVCVYGQLKNMGAIENKYHGHDNATDVVAEALGINPVLARSIVYDPIQPWAAADKCAMAVKLLQRALDDQPSAS